MQQRVQPARQEPEVANPLVKQLRAQAGTDIFAATRRYLMMRPVLFASLAILLVLHWATPSAFDLATMILLLGIYLVAVGSGGLEAARLSGTGGDRRRQERLAEDALRRAGRSQSHLDPCTATDDVVNRILASGSDPRHMVILAANEVETALRAVYRHYSEAERLAGTANGTDLPLVFEVQELVYRGLLPPDIYDTAEPILALREMAERGRSQISQQVATEIARATQAIILRVQSLGVKIQPTRPPPARLRPEPDGADDDPLFQNAQAGQEHTEETEPVADNSATELEPRKAVSPGRERVLEGARRELRPAQDAGEPANPLP